MPILVYHLGTVRDAVGVIPCHTPVIHPATTPNQDDKELLLALNQGLTRFRPRYENIES